MQDKIKKNLYMPEWVAELLDREGDKYEGPGIVSSAAIVMFCGLSETEKAEALTNYRAREIDKAYHKGAADALVDAAQGDALKRKQRKGLRKIKY